jgi:hypothetical protein
VTKGVFLSHPVTWTLGAQYRNAYELLTRTERPEGVVIEARMLITTEQRQSHAEALRRLADIAKEIESPPSFLVIGGWPALQRRYSAPLPRRGQEAAGEEQLTLRVTTAIAAGSLLLRSETTLAPEADVRLAEEAEAIGRSAIFPTRGDPAKVKKELDQLRQRPRSALPVPRLLKIRNASFSAGLSNQAPSTPATAPGALLARAGVGELEIAASNDGQNIVIATNTGYSFSNNAGLAYTPGGGTPATFPADGDPSLAFGASGAFYYGFIAFPNGSAAANNVQGCSTGISVSTDNGQTFQFRNHAVLCPQTGANICFPDQEHIAADSINTASGGGDQVYSVWRNFIPAGAAANCGAIGSGFVTQMLVCSQNGGNNWTAPLVAGTGDFPRITVGPNGSVFVVYRSGNNLMLNRFSSCSAGLTQQPGFPVTIASVNNVACPVPGLDRCNNGNSLSSHMVAVDDDNANHIFVAYATNTAANNENILVRDSTDGGLTWPRVVSVNSSVSARRFMPWICTLGGTSYVTWYDRRAATAANNDLTDFYFASVSVQAGALQAANELNLSGNADPQCASGWPCGARAAADFQSCSVQPQPGAALGGGCPKYGDYNGNTCAGARIFAAWASATAPPGLPAATGINVYTSTIAGTSPPIICSSIVPQVPPGSGMQLLVYWTLLLLPALLASWLAYLGLRRRKVLAVS